MVLANGHPVAIMLVGGEERIPVSEANARLIAAAPEMLEALKFWVRNGMVRFRETPSPPTMARAVIAKAKGDDDDSVSA